MKLWLITRTDETDWDETNAILVRAKDKASAKRLALAKSTHGGIYNVPQPVHDGFRTDNLSITEVTTEGKREVIIVDFLRG